MTPGPGPFAPKRAASWGGSGKLPEGLSRAGRGLLRLHVERAAVTVVVRIQRRQGAQHVAVSWEGRNQTWEEKVIRSVLAKVL